MKIAITSQDKTLDSLIDPRFGRCKYFVLYDTETKDFEIIDNRQILNAAQGAGIQAAETVVRNGASWVLTGSCGPKAFRTLTAAGIKVVIDIAGTVKEAIEKFQKSELKPSESANVEGHWI
ncbi:MAG: dinitrogenase iron-molybdenum cofactor biosynthesis protein [Candidatus Schekmanbacteria bacterium RBG_13_48_7]|uniref:Dinitrogenase iron-molybdenum cofactor biosynthesis protein n=1 Tax=Candidatus Schekmanbacteria bacterium RBG_13_48_7 TaxID=1817878 RepID=A0A1F7S005_9BACT|nr:MAG: dinitrogenase iron-molybdenum cofactor biosynthesis protein [Candidatus Schekmanbacteria bacterium RBG_13_48_7]